MHFLQVQSVEHHEEEKDSHFRAVLVVFVPVEHTKDNADHNKTSWTCVRKVRKIQISIV